MHITICIDNTVYIKKLEGVTEVQAQEIMTGISIASSFCEGFDFANLVGDQGELLQSVSPDQDDQV